MMIVAAARELAGQRVCFVGVGLPNIAVNLAKRTVAPEMELVYEAGVFGARAGPPPALHRRPHDRHRRHRRREHVGALRLLPPGRARRRRLPGGGPDRPLREHQHDRDRRLRGAEDPPAGLRRRLRDRDQRPPDLRDHAPVRPLVRGADRLPDLARQPRRGREGRPDPARAGLARARAVRGRDRPRDLALRRGRRDAPRLPPPGRHPRGGAGDDRLGPEDRAGRSPSRRRPRPPSCASSARSSTPRACTRSRAGRGECRPTGRAAVARGVRPGRRPAWAARP